MANIPPPQPQPPPATGVTEQQIVHALGSLLRDSTISFTSLNGVVQLLESKLGFSLAHYSDFIRGQIQQFFMAQQKDRFVPHQSPNYHSLPPPQQLQLHSPNLNFAPQQVSYGSEGYGFGFGMPTAARSTDAVVAPGMVERSTSVVAPVKESAPTKKRRRGGPGGLNKLCGVSPELQIIVGQPTLPRTEIVKQLWAYIRRHNLQDPNNRRKIICNDELRVVFDTDSTDMFKMNKLLAKHIFPLEPTKQTAQNAKKLKVDEVETGSKSDITIPVVVISEALGLLFATDEREMSQAEVLRQMWEYIKINQLEDPMNPMAIKCDAKLQELLGCDSISALDLPEALVQRHLTKKS